MDLTEAIKELIKRGRESAGPQYVGGGNIPYVIDGNGAPVAMPHLIYNEHTERPERLKADVKVLDTPSFVEYWSHFNDGDSRCFAHEPSLSVSAILDYHRDNVDQAPMPRWCQHRITLSLQQSEEWKVWSGKNNTQFTQQAFAEFLEQNSMDITAPPPGAMMEIARDLIATTECEFAAGLRMQDGQVKFKWTETVNAKVAGGTLQVPEHFTISAPVFIGGSRIDLSALFRFRVKEGKLTMWYTLVRPEEARRRAFGMARDEIAAKLGITILNGSPA